MMDMLQVSYQGEDWYMAMVEELDAIAVETIFNSRWTMIEGRHKIGERIVTDPNFKKIQGHKGKESFIKALGGACSKLNTSDIYRSVQFYEKFPDLLLASEKWPEGKNISWSKIKTNYLPKPKEAHECSEFESVAHEVCSSCGKHK